MKKPQIRQTWRCKGTKDKYLITAIEDGTVVAHGINGVNLIETLEVSDWQNEYEFVADAPEVQA